MGEHQHVPNASCVFFGVAGGPLSRMPCTQSSHLDLGAMRVASSVSGKQSKVFKKGCGARREARPAARAPGSPNDGRRQRRVFLATSREDTTTRLSDHVPGSVFASRP